MQCNWYAVRLLFNLLNQLGGGGRQNIENVKDWSLSLFFSLFLALSLLKLCLKCIASDQTYFKNLAFGA